MQQFLITLLVIIAGAIGYLVVTFVFQPILRYRSIKSQILSDLVFYADVINADGMNDSMRRRLEQRVDDNRRNSANLRAIFSELPRPYKIWLRTRGVNIVCAATELMGLSNTFEYEAANTRITRIKNFLKPDSNVV